MQFNKVFKDEYQFTLKEISYHRIEEKDVQEELELNIKDIIDTNTVHNQLEVNFERNVFFEPEALYELKVIFACTLSFQSDEKFEEFKDVDWEKELLEGNSPYLRNMISRASNLISTITSSYGQVPLITPPVFVKEK